MGFRTVLALRTSIFTVGAALLLAVVASATSATATAAAAAATSTTIDVCKYDEPPNVEARMMMHGTVQMATTASTDDETSPEVAPVMGCCVGPLSALKPTGIGGMVQMKSDQVEKILAESKAAWNGGSGVWPQMTLKARIAAIEDLVQELQKKRQEIIHVLMWEIGKNQKDAASEFDRTMEFVGKLIDAIKTDPQFTSGWETVGKFKAFVRRAAVGIILCLGPYNYPLNETYATLIPALLMGNVVIMKIPTIGGLTHLLTMEAFTKALPAGTIGFVSGSGRATMPPLMSSGLIDGLAFIGGSNAADKVIKQHPNPHRLKIFLQLEAKNMGIFLDDLFAPESEGLLDNSLTETITGTLSYNGQRCTALKLLFVPEQRASVFVDKFVAKVDAMTAGLPWQTHHGDDKSFSQITPLPNQKRVDYMKDLIEDAVSKGAKVVNKDGGSIVGGPGSTLMIPAVLYPVSPDMRVYSEEQFGPVIPITTYSHPNLDTILEYGRNGQFGQQVSIFTAGQDGAGDAASMIDLFSHVFGKININAQCSRSPDSLPFSGRRSSAMGVMSVTDALKEFSIPTVVAYKDNDTNNAVLSSLEQSSRFLEKL